MAYEFDDPCELKEKSVSEKVQFPHDEKEEGEKVEKSLCNNLHQMKIQL